MYLAELEMLNGEIHGLCNFRQTNFKGFSETFYGQVTVSKDKDLFNHSAFFIPLLNTLLVKTLNGVSYDSTSRQPWLIKLLYTTFYNNTLQNDKSLTCSCI